ncbi:Protein of unknown function [Pyronema omphalodes CBS 100304]|uniref:Uncharacterized protein n=1 Tax=Pyronema omphalodes (strain CBS 100304) TaxID=1076935 RepID=U4L3M3_PYROM|nr:Protein of unknown function [Pyronema omphalodes CBS 100304]
MLEFHTLSKL